MPLFNRYLPLAGVLLLAGSAQAQLQPNDLVAVCGDSITEQKQYSVFIEDYLLMCQPQAKLQAMQFGWGGETASGFRNRMVNDVLTFSPNVATTCYGMNDGGYVPPEPGRAGIYRTATTDVVKAFKAAGVRYIVVGSPGAVDTTTFKRTGATPDQYNDTLASLGEIAKQVAVEQGVAFADVHTPMMEVMAKAKAKYGDAFHVAGGDGVHPYPNGHLVMAYAFLKALGCDGNIGTLTFDAKAGTATGTEGHKVSGVTKTGFQVESTKYPFCFYGDGTSPSSTKSMVDLFPFNEDLNRYRLVVKNCPAAKMKVTWGDNSKEFNAADLEKGINLAAEFLDNPFSAPFSTVENAIRTQQNYETPALKGLLHSIPDYQRILPDDAATFATLQKSLITQDQKLRDASMAAVVPVKHEIKIEPAA